MTNYSDYKVEDFVADHFFKRWVVNPDRDSNLFWENWLEKNQQKVSDVKKAREIILGLTRLKYTPSTGLEDDVWKQIEASITEETESNIVPLGPESILARYPDTRRSTVPVWLKVAAAVLILVGSVMTISLHYGFMEVNSEIAEITITEKENPRGQKSTVFLPDGSKVYLNSESKISYDNRFNIHDRVVKLEGEAFFEVAEDPTRPFTVVTDVMNTTALGTSFNVNAHAKSVHEVSLFTGKVRVVSASMEDEVVLFPGELASAREGQSLSRDKFNKGEKALWRNRVIHFADTPFDQALQTLERWYDVSFRIEGQIPNHKEMLCTGKFEDDYLSNVLQSLSYTHDFEFEIQGKEITLTFNPKKSSL